MSRSETIPSTCSPSSLATRAPILPETSASTAAPTVSSGRIVATARPLVPRIVSTFIGASQAVARAVPLADAYRCGAAAVSVQYRAICRTREPILDRTGPGCRLGLAEAEGTAHITHECDIINYQLRQIYAESARPKQCRRIPLPTPICRPKFRCRRLGQIA